MPVRIHVKNFQSIADANLVVDRFTVITGANNSGKTALIRAVQGVFANSSGDAYVRHGTEKLSVELSFDDGKSVKWEKGPKVKPTYTVAGKTLHPGRAVPDEVSALGIQPIQVGQMPVWPQVAPQFTGQVFLLDLPGSSIAEAVADVDRVGRLTQALRYAESDKRSANADLRVRKQDVETGRKDVDAYAGVDAVALAVASVEQAIQEAAGVAAELAEAEDLRQRAATASDVITRYAGVREVQLPEGSLFDAARDIGSQVTVAQGFRSRLNQARSVVLASEGIRKVSVPAPPQEAVAARVALQEAMGLRTRLERVRAARTRAEEAMTALSSMSLDTVAETVAKATKTAKTLEYVESLRERLRRGVTEIESLKESLRARNTQLEGAETDVRSALEALGACPVCGAGVSGSHAHGE